MEYTELRLTDWVAAFPWPRFSDARILGSKYRNPGFGHSEAPAARHEPIYLLVFSVTLWLRGVLLLLKRLRFRVYGFALVLICGPAALRLCGSESPVYNGIPLMRRSPGPCVPPAGENPVGRVLI